MDKEQLIKTLEETLNLNKGTSLKMLVPLLLMYINDKDILNQVNRVENWWSK